MGALRGGYMGGEAMSDNAPVPSAGDVRRKNDIAQALGQGENKELSLSPKVRRFKKYTNEAIAVPLRVAKNTKTNTSDLEVDAVVTVSPTQISECKTEMDAFLLSDNPAYDRSPEPQRLQTIMTAFHTVMSKLMTLASDNDSASAAIHSAVESSSTGILQTKDIRENSCASMTAYASVLLQYGYEFAAIPGSLDGGGHAYALVKHGASHRLVDVNNPLNKGEEHEMPAIQSITGSEYTAHIGDKKHSLTAEFGGEERRFANQIPMAA